MVTIAVAPNFERPGVVAGFVLSAGSGLIPAITKGVLFAGTVMYRPAAAPVLPEAPASQLSWLFYHAGTGFYWRNVAQPSDAADAQLGWVRTGTTAVIASSSQYITVEEGGEQVSVVSFGESLPAEADETSTAPGDVLSVVVMSSNSDGSNERFQLEYAPPDAIGVFCGVTAHWVPDAAAKEALTVDFEYNGDATKASGDPLRRGKCEFVVAEGTAAVAGRIYLTGRSIARKNRLVLYGQTGATPSVQATVPAAEAPGVPDPPALPASVTIAEYGARTLRQSDFTTWMTLRVTVNLPAAPAEKEWVSIWLAQGSAWEGASREFAITAQSQSFDILVPATEQTINWAAKATTSTPHAANSPADAVASAAVAIAGLGIPPNNVITSVTIAIDISAADQNGLQGWRPTITAVVAPCSNLFYVIWTIQHVTAAGVVDVAYGEVDGNEAQVSGATTIDVGTVYWPIPSSTDPYSYLRYCYYVASRVAGGTRVKQVTNWSANRGSDWNGTANGADHIDIPLVQTAAAIPANRLATATLGPGLAINSNKLAVNPGSGLQLGTTTVDVKYAQGIAIQAGGAMQVSMDPTMGLGFDVTGRLLININSTDFQFVSGFLRYNNVDFSKAANFDTAAFKVTSSTFQVNHLNATTITLGTYSVGGGANMPGQLAVFGSGGVMVGWIGQNNYYYGIWGKQAYLGGDDPSTARLVCDTNGNLSLVSRGGGTLSITIVATSGVSYVWDTSVGLKAYVGTTNQSYAIFNDQGLVADYTYSVQTWHSTYYNDAFNCRYYYNGTAQARINGGVSSAASFLYLYDSNGSLQHTLYAAGSSSYADHLALRINGTTVLDSSRNATVYSLTVNGSSAIDSARNGYLTTLSINGTTVFDSSRNAAVNSVSVGGTTVIDSSRNIGSKTSARIIARNNTAPSSSNMTNGEIALYYDSGSGKARIVWFDGGNVFYWNHDGVL